jgi:serine phosphatase RsbU (regulator of sigma subunit)
MAVDEHRTGILVADVTGHGVPTAIIAAMIKVAMQSSLHGLNRILSPRLGAQFISATYLWLDTENRTGSYSAARQQQAITLNALKPSRQCYQHPTFSRVHLKTGSIGTNWHEMPRIAPMAPLAQ